MVSSNLTVFLVATFIAKAITVNFMGYFAALIQLISPPNLRGRLSALFSLTVVAFLGSGFGPLLPALISDNFLHDAIHMGKAIALSLAIIAPLALICLASVKPSIRRSLAEAEAWI